MGEEGYCEVNLLLLRLGLGLGLELGLTTRRTQKYKFMCFQFRFVSLLPHALRPGLQEHSRLTLDITAEYQHSALYVYSTQSGCSYVLCTAHIDFGDTYKFAIENLCFLYFYSFDFIF